MARRAWMKNASEEQMNIYLAQQKEQRARDEQRQEAARDRAYTNSILNRCGYRWSKVGFANEEEADAFSPNLPIGQEWVLFAPDGHSVTVEQAMQELASQGVASAKTWITDKNA